MKEYCLWKKFISQLNVMGHKGLIVTSIIPIVSYLQDIDVESNSIEKVIKQI